MVYVFKLVVVGDANAGKTSLINRYVHGSLSNLPETTPAQLLKDVSIEGEEDVKIQLLELETKGHNVFKPNNSYRGAHAILLLFNLANEGYRSIPEWLEEVSRYCYGNVKVILVGTKVDTIFSTRNASATTAILSSSAINRFRSSAEGEETNSHSEFEASPLTTLPLEILNHVFEYLDLPSLLYGCFVNWDWHRVLNSQFTWMRLYKRDFKSFPANYTDWRSAYIQKYISASETWTAIHKAKEMANQYGLPLVFTSARTGLNVTHLFNEVSLVLRGKIKQPENRQFCDVRMEPLWRGRSCTVLMKHGDKYDHPPLFQRVPVPQRLQIMDSTLFIRGVDSMGIKTAISNRDIANVSIVEKRTKQHVALKVRTREARNFTFLFETRPRAETWRMYILNM